MDKKAIAKLVGELAELASYRDIDTTVMIIESLACQLRVKPESIPGYTELKGM